MEKQACVTAVCQAEEEAQLSAWTVSLASRIYRRVAPRQSWAVETGRQEGTGRRDGRFAARLRELGPALLTTAQTCGENSRASALQMLRLCKNSSFQGCQDMGDGSQLSSPARPAQVPVQGIKRESVGALGQRTALTLFGTLQTSGPSDLLTLV